MSVPTSALVVLTSACLSAASILFLPDLFRDLKLSSVFLSYLAITSGLWGIWSAFIYPSWCSPLRHLPKPKSGAIPLIGYPAITFKQLSASIFLKFITEVPNNGLIRFPGLFNRTCLLTTEPLALADVLVNNAYDFEKPKELRNFLRIILGNGLVLVEGEEHKFQRKHSAPAFSFRHIKELYPIFWQKAIDLTNRIAAEIHENSQPSNIGDEKRDEGIVEINHWANKVTMDIIGIAGLGREFNTLHSADDELIANYEEILEPSTEKVIYFAANLLLPRSLVVKLPWKLNATLDATTQALRNVCRKLVRDKKELIVEQKDQSVDILSLLIKSNNFADEMLVDQLLTYLAAGHETTSSAFTWGTYLLALNPQAQELLRTEIRTHLPPPSNPLSPTIDLSSTIESLPYLHGVCSEILRLFPPVPTTLRIAKRATSISGHSVPAGTRVFLSPYGINRSPHLWDEANSFRPERWIDNDTGKPNNTGGVRSNYDFLTFLHGPRSCIGERFAKGELKALMAVFVGKMAWELHDTQGEVVPAGAITMKPKGGMRLKVRVLDKW